MSSNTVNSGFAKCFILFMAVVILLEGCLYLGLSIWGFARQECSKESPYNVAKEPFEFAVDLIYFRKQCDKFLIENSDSTADNMTIELQIDWETSNAIKNRFNIFLICYAVVSGLWIVSSLMAITSICGKVTKMVSAICFWPWFIFVVAGCVLDAVVTAYSAIDITHTTSAEETLEYIGVTNADNVLPYLKPFDAYFMTPAIVMTCIACRVVLIWLLNIFGTGFCLSMSTVLAANNEATKASNLVNSNSGNNTNKAVVQPANQSPDPDQPSTAPKVDELIKPRPLPIQIIQTPPQQYELRRSIAVQSPQNISQTPLLYPVYTPTPPTATSQSQSSLSNGQRPTPVEVIDVTYRNTDNHPDRLNYPQSPLSPQPQPQPQQQQQQAQRISRMESIEQADTFSSQSPLNNRYSANEGFGVQPVRVSAELRHQLPWSYTNPNYVNKSQPPPPPRKPTPKIQTYPSIPEPDYHDD